MRHLFSDHLHLHRFGSRRRPGDSRSFGLLPKRLPPAHPGVGLDENEGRRLEEGEG